MEVWYEESNPTAELRFAPDDRRLLITDGHLLIQNTTDGTLRELPHKNHSFTKSRWSADGRWILAEDHDNETCLWEVSTGTIVRTFSHRQPIIDLALDGESRQVIVANGDRPAYLLDVESDELLQTFPTQPAAVAAVAISRDGKWALTGCDDGFARLWQTDTGKLVSSFASSTLPPGSNSRHISAACLSSDGGIAVIGDDTGQVGLWHTATEKRIHTWKLPSGYQPRASVTDVRLSKDDTHVIAATNDGLLQVWDAESGWLVREERPPANFTQTRVALSASGRYFAIYGVPDQRPEESLAQDGILEIRDTATWRSIVRKEHFKVSDELVLSDDGSKVVLNGTICSVPDLIAKAEIPVYYNHGAFSADGTIVVADEDEYPGNVVVCNLGADKGVRLLDEHLGSNFVLADFRADGRLITVTVDGTYSVSDPKTADVLQTFSVTEDGGRLLFASLSGDDAFLALNKDSFKGYEAKSFYEHIYSKGSNGDLTIWNVVEGKRMCACHTVESSFSIDCQFAPNGKGVFMLQDAEAIRAHGDTPMTASVATFPLHLEPVFFGKSGNHVLAFDPSRRTLSVWDFATSRQFDFGALHESIRPHDALGLIIAGRGVNFSADGRWLLSSLSESPTSEFEFNSAILYDLTTKRMVRRIDHKRLTAMAVSANGELVATASQDVGVHIWDPATGKLLKTIGMPQQLIFAMSFVPGTRQLVAVLRGELFPNGLFGDRNALPPTDPNNTVGILWDFDTGRVLRSFVSKSGAFAFGAMVEVSPDGEWVIMTNSVTAQLWEVDTGKLVSTMMLPSDSFTFRFSPNSDMLMISGMDGRTRLWSIPEVKEICSIVHFENGEWAVVDPEGRFDTSNGGNVQGMHWVLGDEAIELSQLKDRYYEPGLLDKLLDNNPEPLRDVNAFIAPKLYPSVSLNSPTASDPNLEIMLSDRGGGIGRVVVKVNGKEVTADARNGRAVHDAREAHLTVALKDVPYLRAGDNQIEVAAYNAEGYLRSRGATTVLHIESEQITRPHVWGVACGISDYSGDAIDLRFASKDAEEFGAAVKLAAARLFGADRTHVTVLSSSLDNLHRPTRTNLQAALDTIAMRAKPGDMLVIYLAGHGINHGGENGDFYFLTAEAQSASLTDPAVRQQTAISSEELTAAIKRIPALKQVMILDTCAAGNFVQSLSAGRSVPSSQIRALERLKDRTGLYVLAGCAADQVSYEASRYAQGLVTYSLLLGMRGAALREDQFVDVSKLFEYAADQVPSLARDVGGIQRPIIAVPQGAASFDIGQLLADDRATIQLQRVRPLVLKARFQDEVEFRDTLGLAQRVNDRLRNQASGGREAKWVFVEGQDLPGSLEVVGRYNVQAEQVTAKIRLIRDGDETNDIMVTGRRDQPDAMADEIVRQIQKHVERASTTRQPP